MYAKKEVEEQESTQEQYSGMINVIGLFKIQTPVPTAAKEGPENYECVFSGRTCCWHLWGFYPYYFSQSYCQKNNQKKKKVVQMNALLFTVCKDNKDVLQLQTETRASCDRGGKKREALWGEPSICIEGAVLMQLLSGNQNNLLPLAFSLEKKKKMAACVKKEEKQPRFSPVLLFRKERDSL